MQLDLKDEELNDFHDAIVTDLSLDVANGFASVSLMAYPKTDCRDRSPYVLSFENVSLISSTLDLKEMKGNEFAGTVVHIKGHERDQTTKLYLTGGVILIRSRKMQIEARNPSQP